MGSGISLTPVQISEIVKREMEEEYRIRKMQPGEPAYLQYKQYLDTQKYVFNIYSVDRTLGRISKREKNTSIESI